MFVFSFKNKYLEKIIEQQNKDRNIKLPPISTIFPIKRNPLHDKEEVGAMCRLMKEFSEMPAHHYNRKILDICQFTAYFHPFLTDMKRYLNLCRAMQLFFIIDDQVECKWGQVARKEEEAEKIWDQVDQCFQRLIEGTARVSMAEWKPYIVALYISLEHMFQVYNPVQKRRLAKTYRNWGKGNRDEGAFIRSGNEFESLEQLVLFQ